MLSVRCRQLGIELVPNQNSFGHLRYWLEYPPLKKLAEVKKPYEGVGGAFLRYPTTLAPTNPGTVPFLRELYDELLPYFDSKRFNVGCDETWDLGRGQSKRVCQKLGKGQVYVDFLKQIYREVSERGYQMMFWGDIILHHPNLLKQMPPGGTALNWGYEAGHPFAQETAIFASCGIPFYVCPGTSTWMTLIGRHDNALANLKEAANAGRKAGARGFLNTDWGDGGHPQPLAVSYFLTLPALLSSWCAASYDQKYLIPVLSRDIFGDPTQRTARAAVALGLAHKKFKYEAPNVTPFGTVLTAPPPRLRELVCRDGLKYYARIPKANIERAFEEVQKTAKSSLSWDTPNRFRGDAGTRIGYGCPNGCRVVPNYALATGAGCWKKCVQNARGEGRPSVERTRTGFRKLLASAKQRQYREVLRIFPLAYG